MIVEEQKAAEAALAKGKGSKGSGGGGKIKSEEVIAKALAGNLNKRLAEICLYTQVRLMARKAQDKGRLPCIIWSWGGGVLLFQTTGYC